jgi:hypothetical protein
LSYLRFGLVLSGALAFSACSHGQASLSSVPPVVQANAGLRAPAHAVQRSPAYVGGFRPVILAGGTDPGDGGPAGFRAVSATFTKSLISDDGMLIAEFAKRYGIRTIFLPIQGQDIPNLLARNRATVRNLRALFDTCTVYMETGDVSWLTHPGSLPADARVLAQQIGPMYPHFAGILYDIEPQDDPTWDSNRQGTIDRYFTLLDTLFTAHAPSGPGTYGATLVATIPGFARQPNRSGGESPSMLQAIEAYRAVDGTYLWMAGNSAAAQLERAKAAFPQMQKPYWAISNTAPDSHGNGYSGSTPEYLSKNMAALAVGARAANPNLQGVDVSSWDDRYSSLQAILPQPTPSPIPEPSGPLVPRHDGDYIGAYVAPDHEKPSPASVAGFERQIGRTLGYDIHYNGWKTDFPGRFEDDDVAHDRIPLLSWHCGDSNAHIERGDDDALIRARADALAAFGHPVFLRYEWEMNLNARTKSRKACYDPKTDLPTGLFSPTHFVAAWKRIHSIFLARGATNVVWLWNPGAGGPDPAQYYPGNDEVDWVGLDSYDRHDYSFEDTFVPYLDDLSQFRKPMMITETGAPAHFQPEFFATALDTLKFRYPLVRAFSYLDSQSTDNWSLTPQGLAGYKRLANSPFMSARQPH